ncbi:hypothetical protein NDU88_002923 [Pleurodeles waltl]|uniref:Uncharacterized protein n=1 Tax=Pleurodeles waltl TaxID=8319 RepID=A0AAV7RH43_PLEWA|nr:hypothetical protein NDU88_002923 [Pleurodeles waltl]
MLACSPPHSPSRGAKVRSPGRAAGVGGGQAKVSGAGRAALNGPVSEGGLGYCSEAAGRLQRSKARRHVGVEPTRELHPQGTRAAVIQGGDQWCEEACLLDFDEGSVEEGELVDEGEEEDWWAQGGAGPTNALSQSFQRSLQVQPAVGKALDGAHVGRRKAQERPPSFTAGEESSVVRRVSVAVEATGDLGNGAARLVRGIYVSNVGSEFLNSADDFKSLMMSDDVKMTSKVVG